MNMKILEVTVKPRAKHSEILEETSKQLKVALKTPPEDGKANIELIKLLSKHYKAKVEIIKGHRSKRKLIRLDAAQTQGD